MTPEESVKQLRDYTERLVEAVAQNNPKLWGWSKVQSEVYLADHYPMPKDKELLNRLIGLFRGGPIAYMVRGYGHGVGYDFRDVPNLDLIREMKHAYQVLCVERGIDIAWELFWQVVIHAAAQCDPWRNWHDVMEQEAKSENNA